MSFRTIPSLCCGVLLSSALVACGDPDEGQTGGASLPGQSGDGDAPQEGDIDLDFGNSDDGTEGGGLNTTPSAGAILRNPGATDAATGSVIVTGIIRDFSVSHEDFEKEGPPNAVIQGMVQPDLGADGKPVFAASDWVSAATFDQWYRDVPGVNQPIQVSLELTEETAGVYTYDSSAFFPVDEQGFGNEGNPHNYHFTSEFRSQFEYKGGEQYTFVGDDDLWVFINGKLAIDLGGTHTAYTASVSLDEKAAELGIALGGTYELVLFHAERHTTESNFRIETSIRLEPVVVK